MTEPTGHDKLAEFARDRLPDVAGYFEESAREVVQTTVWLVGLVTGLLALFVAKPESATALGALRPIILGGLMATILLGVAQRLVLKVAMDKTRNTMPIVNLQLWLMTESFNDPLELQEWWDKSTIVRQLRERFGFDFGAQEPAGNLAFFREAYERQFAIWRKGEDSKNEQLRRLGAAMKGQREPEDDPSTPPLENLRRQALSMVRWHRAGNALYWATGILFAISGTLVALTLY